MSKVLVNTKDMSREEWLKYRRMGIGGSDAAAIIGLNPFSSPYTVWADKTGRLEEKKDSEAMRQGRDLESYVVKRFEEKTEKKAARYNKMLQHDTVECALANIDRTVLKEKAGLECKTTSSLNMKKFKNGEFPDTYYCQCMHYLAVTGWDKWYLAVLVLGRDFFVFEIERDEEEIASLLAAENAFWEQHVKSDVAPAVDGLASTNETINKVWHAGDSMDAVALYQQSAITRRLQLDKQIKELKKEQDECDQIIKDELRENTKGYGAGYEVTWKPQTKRTFDVTALQKECPNFKIDGFYKLSEFRTLRFKKIKEEV